MPQSQEHSEKVALASTAETGGNNNTAAPGNTPAASGTTAGSSPATRVTTPAGNPNDEVLKELELMRARIQQLEAQLKTQSGAAPASATLSSNQPQAQSVSYNVTTPAKPADLQTSNNQEPVKSGKPEPAVPFAFADFTWLNGASRTKDTPLDTKFFTGEFRWDTQYIYDYNHPIDHTLVGTSEGGRTGEVQLQQLGVGGDFHWDNVRGRVMTQVGTYSSTQPRNDPTIGRGQFDLGGAYRYISEAYGGYHINALHGINVDAGIFLSYIGLFSFYNFDNWAYQPSYVSSNTPWFFNGVRVQIFPTEKLKIEPWFINGWQSYGTANGRPGLGMQINYRPNGNISIISNNYGIGRDTIGAPHRTRWHTDDSIEVKYYDRPANFLDKMAFSFTGDLGCESGSGVSCFGNSAAGPKQSFVGGMFYNRFWFHKDLYAVTLGGGAVNNPGRYLVLLPPINGATAFSGTPYFTGNPGDQFKAWDATTTFDYLPSQFVTLRFEYGHRASNVPYFAGQGGVTPPGGNTGPLGSVVPGFTPDLRKRENRLNLALLVKF
jgi:hypothetical protein